MLQTAVDHVIFIKINKNERVALLILIQIYDHSYINFCIHMIADRISTRIEVLR